MDMLKDSTDIKSTFLISGCTIKIPVTMWNMHVIERAYDAALKDAIDIWKCSRVTYVSMERCYTGYCMFELTLIAIP